MARQVEEIEVLSEKSEELKKELKEREEEEARASRNHQPSSPRQAIDQTTGWMDGLPITLAQESAEAEIELVREALERNRMATEAENLSRENRVTAALDQMDSRRQVLTDELEDKDAQLYDAQMQIRNLTERLLAASSQPSRILPSAPPSPLSHTPYPPPPSETPLSPTVPPSTIPTSSVAESQPPFRHPRTIDTNVATNLCPRRILTMLATFLLASPPPFLALL